jgi:hypothetical protein
MDPSRKTRLVQARLTSEVERYPESMDGVTNYIPGTLGPFDVARGRRPQRLLVAA